MDIVREKDYDNADNYQVLTEEIVNRAGRTGRHVPSHVAHEPEQGAQESMFPDHLKGTYNAEKNDVTPGGSEEP